MANIQLGQLTSLLDLPDAEAHAARWLDPLNTAMAERAIDNPYRQAAFLAQTMHESGQFKTLVENLHYSAYRLRQVWPAHFKTDEEAAECAGNPEKLANRIYANRLGNGDEASGHGWLYRGRGIIQLTGRDNYERCAHALGIDLLAHPELLAEPEGGARSAAWFWFEAKLNELADRKPDRDPAVDFAAITKRINGGTVGLQARIELWEKARKVLGAQ
ncbi:MAG TPA: glycoside hydrolase family 19 protein [Trinickia sp.]|jgi:putative chitinase|nr:glycoside hydrolase family 19 protein [Trinickia sp.]